MFRRIFILISALIFAFTLLGCEIQNNIKGTEKLVVVATLFPQYDFARQIAGDLANVSLLLPPGVESHAYEPSPSDIIKIQNADIFIYTGKEMEAWAQRIVDSIDKSEVKIIDVSKGLNLAKSNDDGAHAFDPHIWTDPIMAKSIVDNISAAFCSVDSANIAIYKENALNYKSKLDKLDAEIKAVVNGSSHKKLVFGGRFALFYFTNRYNLLYDAAFDSCGSEAEPSAKTILRLINEIKAENLPVIYYEELSEPKVALSISEQTGSKPLLFHSCHNVTKSEFLQGITYLELMERNVAALKEGLN